MLLLQVVALLLVPTQNPVLDAFEQAAVDAITAAGARTTLGWMTKQAHLAGTPGGRAIAAQYKQELQESIPNILSATVAYDNHTVLLSFPVNASLLINGNEPPSGLKEASYPDEDPTSDTEWNSKIWNGAASAEVVYVNRGMPEDFTALAALNVSVRGKVVLVRYGGCFRGVKVRLAEAAGALAVLIFSDPEDYGGDDYPANVYPSGPYLPESGVQRGSVLYLPLCPGNPRGRAAQCGYTESELLPNIPVMPLSAQDAIPILQGMTGPSVAAWTGTALGGDPYPIGPGPTTVNMSVINDRREEEIQNIIVTIPGTLSAEDDTPIVVGNHRDAWVFGAADPNSGSAAMIELVRGIDAAWAAGWRPTRTIIIGSWDAEEFGITGSTAYAEANAKGVLSSAAAYINMDTAVSGNEFSAGASPSLAAAIVLAASKVTVVGQDKPITSSWDLEVTALGGGSDYAPFLNHLGIASADFGFGMEGGYPVYHSIYDSYHWMEKFGDVEFDYHAAAAQVWTLLVMQLASQDILPINVKDQVNKIDGYVQVVIADIVDANLTIAQERAALGEIDSLMASIDALNETTAAFRSTLASNLTTADRVAYNMRLALVERTFLAPNGLPKRTWYKNVLMASGLDKGYGAETLPGITQALRDRDFDTFRQQTREVAAASANAAKYLSTGERPGDKRTLNINMIVGLLLGLGAFLVASVYVIKKQYHVGSAYTVLDAKSVGAARGGGGGGEATSATPTRNMAYGSA